MADVTFGYTTQGATRLLSSFSVCYIAGSIYASGANAGTLNKISAWVDRDSLGSTGHRVKAAIYNNTTLVAVSTTEYTGTDLPTVATSMDFDFSGEAIAASTNYVLVLMLDTYTSTNYVRFHRDDTGGTSRFTRAYPYGDFPATITWEGSDGTRKYSIAATYTEGGGASAVPVIMRQYRQRR